MNEKGHPETLTPGNPTQGVALDEKPFKIRMPDEQTAEAVRALLRSAGGRQGAATLGQLLADGLKWRAGRE